MKACCKAYLDDQFGGDANLVGEIYREYVSSVAAKLEEADQALAAAEWARLDKVAHTIKGNALTAGDPDMAEAAIALRGSAKLADVAEAQSLISRLKDLATLLD